MAAELRDEDALGLKIGGNLAFHDFGDVATDTAFFLGQAGAVNSAAGADAGSSDDANTGHGLKMFLLRGAKNGYQAGPVKTNRVLKSRFFRPLVPDPLEPALNITKNGVFFLIVHQKVVGIRVVSIGCRSPGGDAAHKAADIGVVVEKILVAVQDQHWLAEGGGAVVHAVDVRGQGTDQAQGVLPDVVGVFHRLLGVMRLLRHLDILVASEHVERDACQRQCRRGDLHQPWSPSWDVVAEANDGG